MQNLLLLTLFVQQIWFRVAQPLSIRSEISLPPIEQLPIKPDFSRDGRKAWVIGRFA